MARPWTPHDAGPAPTRQPIPDTNHGSTPDGSQFDGFYTSGRLLRRLHQQTTAPADPDSPAAGTRLSSGQFSPLLPLPRQQPAHDDNRHNPQTPSHSRGPTPGGGLEGTQCIKTGRRTITSYSDTQRSDARLIAEPRGREGQFTPSFKRRRPERHRRRQRRHLLGPMQQALQKPGSSHLGPLHSRGD
jgi:hypothetical protein